MKKRCGVSTIWFLSLFGIVSLLMTGSATASAQASHVSEAKKDSMGMTYKNEVAVIPPIDAAVPAIFETASFGLG
jgi:hypothetical protein